MTPELAEKIEAIKKLSVAYEAARARVAQMGIMTSATDPEKKVAQDAAFLLAGDYMQKTRKAYEDAMAALSPEELQHIVG